MLPVDAVMTLANARNGIPMAPDADGVSMFLSTHAHRPPYFRIDAMPYHAVVHLLRGGVVRIVDGSARKGIPDSLLTGVGTWAMVFGRAIGQPSIVPWMTTAMKRACWTRAHRPTVQAILRLTTIYGSPDWPLRVHLRGPATRWFNGTRVQRISQHDRVMGPAIICEAQPAPWDDRPQKMRDLIGVNLEC
jgi:hypothetical protein